MRDSLSYKGLVGSVHFDADDEVFYGKIAGVTDLVTFEGTTVADLAASFRDAVEDYLVLCRTVGKPARTSYKGSFNVRVPTSLHRRAAEQATVRGISLNRLVQEALEREVGADAGGGVVAVDTVRRGPRPAAGRRPVAQWDHSLIAR